MQPLILLLVLILTEAHAYTSVIQSCIENHTGSTGADLGGD